MKSLKRIFRKLYEDEEGQVAFEYFLLVIVGVAAGFLIIPPVATVVGQLFQAGVVTEITKPYH